MRSLTRSRAVGINGQGQDESVLHIEVYDNTDFDVVAEILYAACVFGASRRFADGQTMCGEGMTKHEEGAK